ncbi:MAG: hypothetical protein KF724_11695 [Phycisphaeraceae bacterium]|nr:hypothetical protein [Phycisphaeraceae bacterium]
MRLASLLLLAALAILTRPASADSKFAFSISFGNGWATPAPVVAPVCAPVVPVCPAPVYAPVVYAPVAYAPVNSCGVAPVTVVQSTPVFVQQGWSHGRRARVVQSGPLVVQQPVLVQQPVFVQQPVVVTHPVVVAPAAPVVQPVAPVHGQFARASFGWRR